MLEAVRRALVPGAPLVFSLEHPILTASLRPRWITDDDGLRSWVVDSYQIEGQRITDWLTNGVVKQHRTIGTVLNMLLAVGFVIRHVEEWGPTEEQLAAQPALAEERERPMMLMFVLTGSTDTDSQAAGGEAHLAAASSQFRRSSLTR